jgi:adenosylcobinamide-GDP ribazoletransferase
MTAAIALLTRIPVRTDGASAGAAAFGLVGAVLGLAAAAPLLVFGPLPGAVLALAILAVASGALHLDGLADTADALAAPTADAGERARQDPRVGPAGAVALVLVLGVDAAALAQTAGRSPVVAAAALVAVVAASRAVATVAPFVAGTVRPGFGRWFAERTSTRDAAAAVVTALVVAAAASLAVRILAPVGVPAALGATLAPAVAGIGALVAGTVAAAIVGRLRDGLDGDGCGAVIELSLAAGLLAASVVA